MKQPARVLVATTTWWPSVAILASALEQAGFDVVMLCPKGHVAERAVRFRAIELDRRQPMVALRSAIDATTPDLIVAGDDRAVDHLRRIHPEANPATRRLIDRSLGRPSSHAVLTGRVALLEAAARAGFSVPAHAPIHAAPDLDRWIAVHQGPWVLKVDQAWGGEGVRIVVDRPSAHRALAELQRGLSLRAALKRGLVNGDAIAWREHREGRARAVSVQAHVEGRPGSCALFVRDGEVLGATVTEAVATCGKHGPSTLLRVVERPDIVACAGRLARDLGLSGFVGLDFLLALGDEAVIIEMNPRITGPCRMSGVHGTGPITAAAEAFGCRSRCAARAGRDCFASFPLAWHVDPFAPELAACRDDVPWREPGILREALKPLWPETGIVASLPSRVRAFRARAGGKAVVDFRRQSFAWWLRSGRLFPPDMLPLNARGDPASARAGADPRSRATQAGPAGS